MSSQRTRFAATAPRLFAVLALAVLAASCRGDRVAGVGDPSAARPTPPPVEMAGRWFFSAGGGSTCTMNLTSDGAIRPEGGCPGNFFTSRKWTFENNALVMRDHNGQPLAQLTQAGPNRFEGPGAQGPQVSLAR